MIADRPRLAEALAALSLAGDLGMGFPLDHAVRVTYVASRVAEAAGLRPDERSDVFYAALLHGIGCTADAHDLAAVFSTDEIELKFAGAVLDEENPRAVLRYVLARAGTGGPAVLRPVAIVRALSRGDASFADGLRAHCEVGELFAARLDLPAGARDGLLALFERWDGKGVRRLAGTDIPLAARFFHVAKTAVAHLDHFDPPSAVSAVREQAGRGLQPELAEAFLDGLDPSRLLDELADPGLATRLLDLEPADRRLELTAAREDALLGLTADMADIKAPWFVGHSRAVAALAVESARRLGLPADEVDRLGRSALVHDLGRVAVPNSILDKRRSLTPGEWEAVRLHPYQTERVLLRSTALARYAEPAGAHHERLDASGYHRGLPAPLLRPAARLLAAADCYQALTSARPWRDGLEPGPAAALARGEVRAGRLDGDAVEAVVAVAHGLPARRIGTAGRLSEREVEVLELLAAGLSTREVASRLSITEKTVRHHVEHIYDKLGVSTRAAAVVAAIGEGRLGGVVTPR